jgi:hypothetical protein
MALANIEKNFDEVLAERKEYFDKLTALRAAAQRVVDEYYDGDTELLISTHWSIKALREVLKRHSNITDDYSSFESHHAGEQRDLTKIER